MSSLLSRGSSWKAKTTYTSESDSDDDVFGSSSQQSSFNKKGTAASSSSAAAGASQSQLSPQRIKGGKSNVNGSSSSSVAQKRDRSSLISLDSDSDENKDEGGGDDDLLVRMNRRAEDLVKQVSARSDVSEMVVESATLVAANAASAPKAKGKSSKKPRGKAAQAAAAAAAKEEDTGGETDELKRAREVLNMFQTRSSNADPGIASSSSSSSSSANSRCSKAPSVVNLHDDDGDDMWGMLPAVLTAAERARLQVAPEFSLDLLESTLGIEAKPKSSSSYSGTSSSAGFAEASTSSSSSSSSGATVKLKTRLNGKLEGKWIIGIEEPFSKMKAKVCEFYGCAIDSLLRFEFDGEDLDNDDTPAQQEMEDDFLIDIKVPPAVFEAVESRKKEAASAAGGSSSSSSSSRVPAPQSVAVNKSASLSAENRMVMHMKLHAFAHVTQTAQETVTTMKVFTDLTLAKVHSRLVSKGLYRAEIADQICYTVERVPGKASLLNPLLTLLDLRIDDDATVSARLPNLTLTIRPPTCQNLTPDAAEQHGHDGTYQLKASPTTSLSVLVARIMELFINPLDANAYSFALVPLDALASIATATQGNRGNGRRKKNTAKNDAVVAVIDMIPLNLALQGDRCLHDLGFVDGMEVRVQFK